MGGAALYLWLPLLCTIFVASLFAIGWGLAYFRRAQEPKGRSTPLEPRPPSTQERGSAGGAGDPALGPEEP